MNEAPHHAIEALFLEERRYPPPPELAKEANAQPGIYERDFADFWATEARERVTWSTPFDQVCEWDPPYARWFLGGRLNACYNCVDRHVEAGRGDKVAFYWEGEPEGDRRTTTFADLQGEVVRFANALKELGVGKGTPVGIYMGMVPELPVAMLACARLGAPQTVVFGGFSSASLAARLRDMQCKVLVTQDGGWRRGGAVPLKASADQALADAVPVRADGRRGPALPALLERDHGPAQGHRPHHGRLPGRGGVDPLLRLRRQAGHGLLVRGRQWSIVERYRVTVLYTAPTAIRTHMKWGAEHAAKHDLSSLQLLGTVGEPINPEAWVWYQQHIGGGRTPVVDTWWQTETDMIMISPLPGLTTLKPGSATRPFPGVDAAVYDDQGNELGPGQAIVAYGSLRGDSDGSRRCSRSCEHVAGKIGKIAMPANIVFTPELPKTRSGKILRRLLRDVAEQRTLGDTTTLADPNVVEEIQRRAATEAAAAED